MPIPKRSESMSRWVNERQHIGRAARVRVSMPVVLELAPARRVKGLICDLSKEGFRLRSGALLYAGQAVSMHLPRQTVVCQVRWVDGIEAGGIFAEKVELPEW